MNLTGNSSSSGLDVRGGHTQARSVTLVHTNLKSGLETGASLHLLPKILQPTLGGEPPGLIVICEARWWQRGGERRSDLGPGYRTLAGTDWEQRGHPECGLAGTTVTAQSLPIDHILVDDTVELVSGSLAVHLNPHSDHGVRVARTLNHPPQVVR